MLAPLLFATFACVGARVFTPCEFATELTKPEHKVNFWQIPTWVCIAHHASGLDTTYSFRNQYFGVFRISSFWCARCRLNCSDLADEEVAKDIDCAVSVVHKEHGGSDTGFHGWGGWYTEFCSKPWVNLKEFDCSVEPVRFTNSSLLNAQNVTSSPSNPDASNVTRNHVYLGSQSEYFWSDFFFITLLCSAYVFIVIFAVFLCRSNLYERLT